MSKIYIKFIDGCDLSLYQVVSHKGLKGPSDMIVFESKTCITRISKDKVLYVSEYGESKQEKHK